jgi:DNA-binding NarL/FixJ family response regulator
MNQHVLVDELSDRELEIVRMLARGLSNKQIAQSFSVTLRNIKYQTGKIYAELGVPSRAAVIAWAWRHRIIQE